MEKNKKGRKDSYTTILVMLMISIVITASIGIVAFRIYIGNFKKTMDSTSYSQYYVMIVDDRKSSFWQSTYQGAYEAGIEENVYVDLLGDNLSSEYTKEDLMRIAIASGVDGIIVAADESEEMLKLIDEAAEEGIPVVTLYGDNVHSRRCSFVGVGNYNLGREYGRQVLKIVEDAEEPQNVAVLVNAYAQDSGQNIVCSGIQETIDMEKKEGTQLELSLVSIDDTNAFSVEESIRDIFMEEEIPDIIICLNELNTTCVYQAVIDYNKVGQVNILGYYDSDTIMKAIERNVIYATVSVDTVQMGKYCIDALTEYYELGYTSQYFTTDITLIHKDNVSEYLGGGNEDEE